VTNRLLARADTAFEFLAGHCLFGNPWSRLLDEDYDVFRARVWVLALLTTAAAPLVRLVRGDWSARGS
jgi:hypothetical protein